MPKWRKLVKCGDGLSEIAGTIGIWPPAKWNAVHSNAACVTFDWTVESNLIEGTENLVTTYRRAPHCRADGCRSRS
ncbi:hypothetical protein EVAR_78185_1 [Eumeta japonica]|uniref:Uncharacterized protein n=1 Tax=Eumeta variegata TaxID=151549 RepID=A0A4C1UYR5_EUMVA|nr:hypothetical protein EVAR_78185_1 [Eumeta japonica]